MLAATLLALGAAVLHAAWNLVVKTSGDRELAAWGQFAFGGLLFVPVLVVIGLPDAGAWPYIIASALVHILYVEGLVRAYHHGDFSFAYPIARGGGAVCAAVGAAVILGDDLPALAWAGVAVVGIGLMSLVRRHTSRASITWASATAVVIGTYTVIDGDGARHTSNGFAYGVALTICAGIALSVVGVAKGRGPDFVASLRPNLVRYLFSGVCLTAAYSLVLVAVRIHGVQVGYVATLRESSVVLGAWAGWIFLKERLGRARLVSSCVVLAGMILLVLGR